jgi:hypothetical protein
MEAHPGNPEQAPPDFYEEWGGHVLTETTDRLFRLMEPATGWIGRSRGREPEVIAVDLSGDEVPEELRGIGFSLSRPASRGCGAFAQVALMNYTLANGRCTGDGPRPLTEAVASRVADYIEERRAQIEQSEREGETGGGGYVRRRKELDAFLESLNRSHD